jgi:hypothetical protein
MVSPLTDPAAHLHVGGVAKHVVVLRAAPAFVAVMRREFVLDVVVHGRQLAQERAAVVGQGVLDLVGHGQLFVAQHAGLPQRGDTRLQQRQVARVFLGRERQVALGQQARDVVLGVQDGLALHFGRVRGQHRRDQRVAQESLDRGFVDTGALQAFERVGDRRRLRFRTGQQMRAAAAYVVLVFGDVGQVRKVGKGAHDRVGLFARELCQQRGELGAGLGVNLAAEAHRGLANGLDQGEHGFAFLVAQHVAEQAAEQADVFLQGRVLVGAGGRLGLGCLIVHIDHRLMLKHRLNRHHAMALVMHVRRKGAC